ncbi:MAG: SIS domain-containing protein, partial [Clostridia bacterium]|nr:SIS domain-containing protein [Clostridia bacterium]
TCMVIISQSGMSKDTVAVMEKAIANGAMTIAVTNNADSPIAKNADFHLFMDVEEEKSVAATKTYIGELFALYMLTNALRGNFDCNLDMLADRISEILYLNPQIADVAKNLYQRNNFIVLSRGTMLGTGDECALKLTECCYLFNRSYSSANFMHGPLSLLDENANVIMLAPKSEFNGEFIDMAKRASKLGANLTVFSNIPEVLELADNKIVMPDADTFEAPVLYGTAVSLLALNIGLAKGLNVDTPRNLNKVTITL